MSVARFDRGSVRTGSRTTDEGYIRADAIVTRTGVLLYRNPDGSTRRELRHPDEVFKQDSLDTMKLIPITDGHPNQRLVNAANFKELAIGYTGETVSTDGDFVVTSLVITDEKAVKTVKELGKRELSLGYTVDLVKEDGEYNGQKYDYRQTNIKYNHLSIVEKARAGAAARIHLDQEDGIEIEHEGMEMETEKLHTITLDGLDYKASSEVINALKVSNKAKEEIQVKLDALTVEMEKAKAEKDALKEKLDAAQSVDVESIVAERVKERVKTIAIAQNLLDGMDLAEMSDMDIKKAVILKHHPKANLDSASDVYVQARFDAVVEDLADKKPSADLSAKMLRGDGVAKDKPVTNAQSALERMKERLKNDWMTKE